MMGSTVFGSKIDRSNYNNTGGNSHAHSLQNDLNRIQEVDWSEDEERSFSVEDGVYHTLGICTLRAQEDLYS